MKRIQVKVVQLGTLSVPPCQVNNTLDIANRCQNSFSFGEIENINIDLSSYLVRKQTYDLEAATNERILPHYPDRPLIILSSERFGIKEPNDEFFVISPDRRVSIISTHLWENLEGERPFEPYLLFMMGGCLISDYTNMEPHFKTMGCIFDYCDIPAHIDRSFYSDRFFCPRCEDQVKQCLASGTIKSDILVSAMKLIHRARGIDLSCFISYSSKDDLFAKTLYKRMKRKKLRVWRAPENIRNGRIHEQLELAIQLYDKLLVVLSKNSIKSKWVDREIQLASREGAHKLLPIRIHAMAAFRKWKLFDHRSVKDWAEEIQQDYIYDFSDWKTAESFNQAFNRLTEHLEGKGDGG